LGSIVFKVIDNITLENHKYVLRSSDLQYGFKAKDSTSHCTLVLHKVSDYYTNNDSSVFLVLLDASRAFNRVQHVKLFKLLIKRGLCSLIAPFLAYLYTNQSLMVNWNGCYNYSFNISNGVKQGGIPSQILFCIYMDELLYNLKVSNVGCYIGYVFLGGLAYTDDVCLLTPNRGSKIIMLKSCEDFNKEYDVVFNSSKSHLIIYDEIRKYQNMVPLCLHGETIHIQRVATHLGHPVGIDNVNSIAIREI